MSVIIKTETRNLLGMNLKNKMFVFACLLVMMCMFNCASAASTDSQYSDLPPPPAKPDRFTSKQQLKEYLVKLHEYYAIIGRPRFGRSAPSFKRSARSYLFPTAASLDTDASQYSFENQASSSENDFSSGIPVSILVETLDQNNDGLVNREELINFLKIFEQK